MITTDFWRDSFIDELDPAAKLIFLYLLCNPATNLCGIYQLPLRIISSDTGIGIEQIETIFVDFAAKKRAYYINGWVILPNSVKHQDISNIKIKSGMDRELEEVSKDLLTKIKELGIPYGYPIDRVSQSELSLVKVKVKVKYSKVDEDLAKILFGLIKENNPAWYVKPNWDQWAEDIRKIREIDSRTEEQIKFIIEWAQNDNFWKGNILSPSKLRKQFNTLVVQAKAKGKKGMVVL